MYANGPITGNKGQISLSKCLLHISPLSKREQNASSFAKVNITRLMNSRPDCILVNVQETPT